MKDKVIKLPGKLGQLGFAHDNGSGVHMGGMVFRTNLKAEVFRNGKPLSARQALGSKWLGLHRIGVNETLIDLGSGKVTNVGCMALANEAVTLASPSGARINTLFLANQHVSGKGATGDAATDYKIQTISTSGGQTAVAGAQTIATTTTGAVPIYQTVATIAYTNTEAVTEWGLMTSATLTSTTGTPFTAATATTWQDTGSVQTASSATIQGLQQTIVEAGTTTVLGLNSSNTTHIATLFNNGTTGWWTQAAQTAGATPGNTEAFTIRPVMWDHKNFAAINVLNGDSIQFTYKLTFTSGG